MAYQYTDEVAKLRKYTAEDEDGEPIVYGASDHAVLGVLANHADHRTGVCWPEYSLIAAEAHVSYSTVRRTVPKLAWFGFISIETDPDDGHHIYTVHMDKLVEAAEAKSKKKSKNLKYKGKTCARVQSSKPNRHAQMMKAVGRTMTTA